MRSFSSEVWKRPWPNLDAVSMNLSLISSSALRLVWGSSVRRSVMGRLTVPGTAPCVKRKGRKKQVRAQKLRKEGVKGQQRHLRCASQCCVVHLSRGLDQQTARTRPRADERPRILSSTAKNEHAGVRVDPAARGSSAVLCVCVRAHDTPSFPQSAFPQRSHHPATPYS